jgi:hypothetical protein
MHITKKRVRLLSTNTKVFLSLLAIQLAFPKAVSAQTSTWSGVCVYDKDPEVPTLAGLQCLIANVLSVALTVLGMVGFVMMFFGAFQWLISGGNSQKVEKARGTMTWAVAGIVLALSSFMILRLLAEFTGVKTILNFTVPNSNTDWR